MTEYNFEWIKIEKGYVLCCGEFCMRCEDEPEARRLAEEKMKNLIGGENFYLTIIGANDLPE
jgi:hypothetical protein